MTKANMRSQRSILGKASRVTRGAGGHMIEAGGLWGNTGLSRD